MPFIGTTGSGQLVSDTAGTKGKYYFQCGDLESLGIPREPTFVFQSESGCGDADVGEEVKVELVGGAVEQCRDGGTLGRGLGFKMLSWTNGPVPLR